MRSRGRSNKDRKVRSQEGVKVRGSKKRSHRGRGERGVRRDGRRSRSRRRRRIGGLVVWGPRSGDAELQDSTREGRREKESGQTNWKDGRSCEKSDCAVARWRALDELQSVQGCGCKAVRLARAKLQEGIKQKNPRRWPVAEGDRLALYAPLEVGGKRPFGALQQANGAGTTVLNLSNTVHPRGVI